MNPDIIAVLSRERRRAVREDYAQSAVFALALRSLTARILRTSGEGLFRLGVTLDERVSPTPVAELPSR